MPRYYVPHSCSFRTGICISDELHRDGSVLIISAKCLLEIIIPLDISCPEYSLVSECRIE